MNLAFTESIVEEAALAWLESIGWSVAHEPSVAPHACGGTNGLQRSLAGPMVIGQISKNVPNFPHGEILVYEAPDGELRVKDAERFIGRTV